MWIHITPKPIIWMHTTQWSTPINGYKMWPKFGFTLVLPPLERRKLGRPRKLRTRDLMSMSIQKTPPSWERLVKTHFVVRGVANMATIGEHALLLWKRALTMLEKRVKAARVWPNLEQVGALELHGGEEAIGFMYSFFIIFSFLLSFDFSFQWLSVIYRLIDT